MKRFTPATGFLLVLAVVGLLLAINYWATDGFERSDYTRIGPDKQGQVRIHVGDLEPLEVRFFRFLNFGNQEVKFFVGRDGGGAIHVAFDASTSDYKRKRGFRHQGEWIVNNKCETSTRLARVNTGGGGCAPVPIEHRLHGDQLILDERAILTGWRFFR